MPSSAGKTCARSEEHTSELQSHDNLVCRLLLEKKKPHDPDDRPHPAHRQQQRPRRDRRRRNVHARSGALERGAPELRYDRVPRCFFFFNDPAPPEIYPLSLHDALPIWERRAVGLRLRWRPTGIDEHVWSRSMVRDRKSTRLNSSHTIISYAVFCLK